MKVTCTVFVIFALRVIGTYCETEQNLRALAGPLLQRVDSVRIDANNVLNLEEHARFQVPNQSNDQDFGISKDKQMIDLDNTLRALKLKRGIDACQKIRNDNVDTLKEEYKNTFRTQTYKRIDVILYTTREYVKELGVMDNGLRDGLANTIKACLAIPNNCGITRIYPPRVTQIAHDINEYKMHVDNIAGIVIQTVIAPTISSRVAKDIVGPVKQCISRTAK